LERDDFFLPPVEVNYEQDFRAAGLPWHLEDLDMQSHWTQTGRGKGVRVGVADTGIDENHQEIEGRLVAAKSFVGGRFRGRTVNDRNGHGTHVATTIVGKTVGYAPEAELVVAKVLSDGGSGGSKGIAAGIDWLVAQGCHIINLSLGSSSDNALIRGAVLKASDAGVLVFAATGNEGANRVGFPAAHCVGVGAVNRKFKLAKFSNRGKKVDAVCYGVDVYAGIPGGRYASFSGTSMATPCLAGLAANRLSAELKYAGEIKTDHHHALDRLSPYVVDLGKGGVDSSYGRGFPDLTRAFYESLGRGPQPVPPQQPEPITPITPAPPDEGDRNVSEIPWATIIEIILSLIEDCQNEETAVEALRKRRGLCALKLTLGLRQRGYRRRAIKTAREEAMVELREMSRDDINSLVAMSFGSDLPGE